MIAALASAGQSPASHSASIAATRAAQRGSASGSVAVRIASWRAVSGSALVQVGPVRFEFLRWPPRAALVFAFVILDLVLVASPAGSGSSAGETPRRPE